ncbi:hypothetical protein EZJ19_13945 [Parasulfuritortus cantonensis]|uniref:Transmembrane protein n=1 Tax=Parasulfuritortus cantonensis TaxID=2528202 RepID=A0A4R1B5I3_9PROT|nr:hypothetical protein [Parasulfuritortus cantonensis]TCJ11757.1 hypothetical protein EZJ19_13945 [Parasulfuritortus cantonensis]
MNQTDPVPATTASGDSSLALAHVIYGLHALSALAGLTSAAFVITAFLSGWPSIIAVILNYLKRGDVRGTWLDSHFGWQIRTFWFALLWLLVAWSLAFTLIGIPAALLLMLGVGLWIVYRIARGWLALLDRKPMPTASAG